MAGSLLTTGRGPVYLIVTWIETFFALILYSLRARHTSTPHRESEAPWLNIRLDFLWVTIAMITALCAESFLTTSVVFGTGHHQSTLAYDQLVLSNLWSWLGQIMGIVALIWGRFAVIAFLLALQGSTHARWRIALYAVGAAQALINIIEVGLILSQCSPVEKLWDTNIEGTCDLIELCSQVGFLQGSIGAFSDLFLALYPIVLIGKLQHMRLAVKIGLCLVMAGGMIACIAGAVKTYQIGTITQTGDISYATLDLLIWVTTEMWFVIIFGSLPPLRSVLVAAGKNVKSRATGNSYRLESVHQAKKSTLHGKFDPWIELTGNDVQHRPRVTTGKQSGFGSRKTDSEEEILAPAQPDMHCTEIWIIRETTIISEKGVETAKLQET